MENYVSLVQMHTLVCFSAYLPLQDYLQPPDYCDLPDT